MENGMLRDMTARKTYINKFYSVNYEIAGKSE